MDDGGYLGYEHELLEVFPGTYVVISGYYELNSSIMFGPVTTISTSEAFYDSPLIFWHAEPGHIYTLELERDRRKRTLDPWFKDVTNSPSHLKRFSKFERK